MSIVVGISMVKDEMDILPLTIKHMLTQVDELLILDDGSTDGTMDWLDNNDIPTFGEDRCREGYYQSEKMTWLAKKAVDIYSASWVVPFDADEFWTSPHGTIKEVCEANEDTYGIVTANLYDHMVTGQDPMFLENPTAYMQWRRVKPLPLFKVCCRTDKSLVIDQGNHNARYCVPARRTEEAGIVVHHYPYRSHKQFIRKVRNGAAAYAKTDLPESIGDHWRKWGKFTDEQLIELFYKYYYVEDPTKPYMLDDVEEPALYKDPFNVR
jgi:glycosyltransferase involved in cell wall biosynthesis